MGGCRSPWWAALEGKARFQAKPKRPSAVSQEFDPFLGHPEKPIVFRDEGRCRIRQYLRVTDPDLLANRNHYADSSRGTMGASSCVDCDMCGAAFYAVANARRSPEKKSPAMSNSKRRVNFFGIPRRCHDASERRGDRNLACRHARHKLFYSNDLR